MMRKPIPGYERYSVDANGIVYGISGAPMKPTPTRKGYLRVTLRNESGSRTFSVHTLVLTAFVRPRPLGMQACHYDGNKENNALTNLRWGTHAENENDKVTCGTKNYGPRNGAAKLTPQQVLKIADLKRSGRKEWGRNRIAAEFSVSKDLVSKIAQGKLWSHLTGIDAARNSAGEGGKNGAHE